MDFPEVTTEVLETNGSTAKEAAITELIDVNQVATILDCSDRHVRRLADRGKMPRGLKLGHLVRWRRSEIMQWLDDGCPAVRPVKGGRR